MAKSSEPKWEYRHIRGIPDEGLVEEAEGIVERIEKGR